MDSNPNVPEIRTRDELIALARELGTRPDWHEPDEQGVTARWGGTELDLDNAMGVHWYGDWLPGEPKRAEMYVILCRKEIEDGTAWRGPDIATINLANLLAWASEPHDQPAQVGDFIGPRGPIPANVIEVEDSIGDTWIRQTPPVAVDDDESQLYDWATTGGGGWATDESILNYLPVKVTKVRGPHEGPVEAVCSCGSTVPH